MKAGANLAPTWRFRLFFMLRGIGLSMKELKENSFVWGFEREEV